MKMLRRTAILLLMALIPLISYPQEIADREVEEFNSVRIFGNITVVLEPGSEHKVHIETNNVSLEEIKTEVDDKDLEIKCTSQLFKNPEVFIRITYNDLNSVTALGDADIDFEKPLAQDYFEVKSTMGSHIMFEIAARQMEVKAYQGGQVQVNGEVEELDAYVNTGGILSATELICNKVDLRMNTGGQCELTVQNELKAVVNTGSDFSYYGKPEIKKVNTSFGGTVSAWDEDE